MFWSCNWTVNTGQSVSDFPERILLLVTHRVQLVYVDGTGVLEPGYSSVSASPHSTTSQGTLRSLPLVIIFLLGQSIRNTLGYSWWIWWNPCFDGLIVFLICQIAFPISFYVILTFNASWSAGSSDDVSVNSPCEGFYDFHNFTASAVCFTNPLKTGKYVGILTTKMQSLQLCEIEVYLRGNFSLTVYTKLNVR